ncbi:integrase, catalytic region, zinc finger, CCHC-type containing protein [Tanacetum coccineum]
MVADLRYFNSLEHEVDTLKSQLETQKTQFLNEIDRLLREYLYADHMNAILGVYTDMDEVTNLQCDYLETWKKCEHLEKELSKNFSKSKSVTTQNVSYDFSKPVTAQILPQNVLPIFKNTNVIAPGMYKVHTKPNQTRTPQLPQDIRKTNKRVSFSTGVIPTTSVSRPQLKSNQLEDRVMPNNSQGKKQNVEDHRRNFKFSNNKTSVTACNDSLNAKTLNVNFVCVTCGKCVLNDNHDLCVLHYINGVNSRTRQPMDVPISTREPKHNVNQSVATSSKKTVATDSTVKKSRNITRKLYEQGNDLLTGSRGTDLYSITLQDSTTPNPICLMAKATSSQAWLWHPKRNVFTLNTTSELKKTVTNSTHGLMWSYAGESIMGLRKKYVLVIVDDYSRYTWTHFLRSKDETPGVLIDFLTLVQRGLHAQVTTVRTDKGIDGENLDKMKEKGDACIFVGYSTQSKAYRVFNKRTRIIVETIHVNFDELPLMASDHVSSDLAEPPLNIHTTPQTTNQAPTQVPTVTTPKNIIQAEINTEYAQVDDDKFINIFSTPVQEQGETSSCHVDSLNMHTFYQHHPFGQRWIKDHPLEQVIGNPSQSIRSRRQLETDGEMCMFVLTEELHQFDRLDV